MKYPGYRETGKQKTNEELEELKREVESYHHKLQDFLRCYEWSLGGHGERFKELEWRIRALEHREERLNRQLTLKFEMNAGIHDGIAKSIEGLADRLDQCAERLDSIRCTLGVSLEKVEKIANSQED